jgi:signal transduction histidine kinase
METRSRLLIIDDEEVVRDSCAQIVRAEPFDISTASDGLTGLELVAQFQPDLVFVDLKMPGISGFEVLEKLRELDPTIVSVVITGFATVSSAVEAMKQGAYDFLPKPFTPDEFRLITRRALEKRRLVLETIALRNEKEMLREQFASIVSHELKAPLGAVQQNLMALEFQLSTVLTEPQRDQLARGKGRIDELLKLVNSWLRLFSVDTNELQRTFTEVRIGDVLSAAVETLETYSDRKDVEVQAAVGDSLPPVSGDRLTLVEAFTNIVGNAIKYSRDGGKIHVSATENGSSIQISVADGGVGIPAEDLPHIFEGFYRGAAKSAAVGQGIGLAVTRQIVAAHGGSIAAESHPGQGTTMTVRLPKAVRGQPPKD